MLLKGRGDFEKHFSLPVCASCHGIWVFCCCCFLFYFCQPALLCVFNSLSLLVCGETIVPSFLLFPRGFQFCFLDLAFFFLVCVYTTEVNQLCCWCLNPGPLPRGSHWRKHDKLYLSFEATRCDLPLLSARVSATHALAGWGAAIFAFALLSLMSLCWETN